MKTQLFVPIILAFLLAACATPPELSPNEKTQRLLINKTWDLSIVTVDGIARNIYSGLSLKFQQSTYTSENGLDIFPVSGTWEFSGSEGNKIIRDDGLEIVIESITDSQLTLNFYWSSSNFIGGRSNELAGLHRFILSKRLSG
jgi:hypothetical protein